MQAARSRFPEKQGGGRTIRTDGPSSSPPASGRGDSMRTGEHPDGKRVHTASAGGPNASMRGSVQTRIREWRRYKASGGPILPMAAPGWRPLSKSEPARPQGEVNPGSGSVDAEVSAGVARVPWAGMRSGPHRHPSLPWQSGTGTPGRKIRPARMLSGLAAGRSGAGALQQQQTGGQVPTGDAIGQEVDASTGADQIPTTASKAIQGSRGVISRDCIETFRNRREILADLGRHLIIVVGGNPSKARSPPARSFSGPRFPPSPLPASGARRR